MHDELNMSFLVLRDYWCTDSKWDNTQYSEHVKINMRKENQLLHNVKAIAVVIKHVQTLFHACVTDEVCNIL